MRVVFLHYNIIINIQRMRILFLSAVALWLAAALTGCGASKKLATPESVRAKGVLKVAASAESDYPYLYWDNGVAKGIEADVMTALAQALDAQAEFVAYQAQDVGTAVGTGAADIGIAGYAQNYVRGLAETASYHSRRSFVLTRRGEVFPNPQAMDGQKVCTDGSFQLDGAELLPLAECVQRLTDGSADAVLCDEFDALTAVENSGEALQADWLPAADERRLVAVVAKENTAFIEFIDNELLEMRSKGE